MVFTDFSSNITTEDLKISLKYILNPLKWRKIYSGSKLKEFKDYLSSYFNASNDSIFLFDSGRSCIYIALKSIGVEDKEVIIPGYTCSVIINAVQWAGAKPKFIDVKEDFNLDHKKIKSKISNKTKAIIVHHTFGFPADIKKIKQICKENNITLIEDCANAVGGKIRNKKAGKFGDISIFSLGANKVVSSIRGGILLVNNADYSSKIKKIGQNIRNFPLLTMIKYLIYSPIFYLGRKTYRIGFGKLLLKIFKKLHFLPRIIEEKEKKGIKPDWIPAKLPNFLSELGLTNFKNLDKDNDHRKKISKIYKNKLPNQIIPETLIKIERIVEFKFPILVNNPKQIQKKMFERGFQLSLTWTGSNIVPSDFNNKSCYNDKQCPKAEELAKKILLLPVNKNVSKVDAKEISKNLINLVKNSN